MPTESRSSPSGRFERIGRKEKKMDFLSEIDHLASTLAFFGMLLVAAKWITKRLAPKKADPFFSKLHKPVGYLTAIAGITRKKDLLLAMSGHVLQTGEIIGWYQPCKTGKNERKNEMKKQFFIPACVLAAAAIGFAIYAAGHPEMSFSWSIQITHILYGLYVDAVMLLLYAGKYLWNLNRKYIAWSVSSKHTMREKRRKINERYL